MTVEWNYDNPTGGDIEIDASDYAGMSRDKIEDAIYQHCLKHAKQYATCYVVDLDEIVSQIIAENEEAGDDD